MRLQGIGPIPADILVVAEACSYATAKLGQRLPRPFRSRLRSFLDAVLPGADVHQTALKTEACSPAADAEHKHSVKGSDRDLRRLREEIEASGCRLVVALGKELGELLLEKLRARAVDDMRGGAIQILGRPLLVLDIRKDSWLGCNGLDNADARATLKTDLSIATTRLGRPPPDLAKAYRDWELAVCPDLAAQGEPVSVPEGLSDRKRTLAERAVLLERLGLSVPKLKAFHRLFSQATFGYRIRSLGDSEWATISPDTPAHHIWSQTQLLRHFNHEFWLSSYLPPGFRASRLTDMIGLDIDLHSDEQQVLFPAVMAALRRMFPLMYWIHSSDSDGVHGLAFTAHLYPTSHLQGAMSYGLLRSGLLYGEVDGKLIQTVEVKTDGLRLPFGACSYPLHMPGASVPEMVDDLLRQFGTTSDRIQVNVNEPELVEGGSYGELVPNPARNEVVTDFPRAHRRQGIREVVGETGER